MRKRVFTDGWRFGREGETLCPVILPHDAQIHEPRTKDAPGGAAHGYFPGGVYVYEKTFTAPEDWKEKTVLLEFEGVYKNAVVSVNGMVAGTHAYGYTGFTICLDSCLKYGTENTIRVTADNSKLPNSRWYSGAGIYRPVNLYVADRTHIAYRGVKIDTVSLSPPRIRVETAAIGGQIIVEIRDGETVVASGAGADLELEIPNGRLWSDETPALYTCHVTLKENGEVKDTAVVRFGIRKVTWSSKGLFINGKSTLLRGGCIHHDNGILGAAAFEKSEERKVRILKEAGFNAIRSAHNPCSEALLAACDKYGVYVMDETFDMWYTYKSKYDYALDFEANWRSDTREMVAKDYDHPSVIMYSIGNEVSEPHEARGVEQTRKFVEFIHSLDPSRAVTGGMNLIIISMAKKGKWKSQSENDSKGGKKDAKADGGEKKSGSLLFNTITSFVGTSMNRMANSNAADAAVSPSLDLLDIAGYNYGSGRYPLEGKKHPDRVILGSETFPQDIYKNWQMVQRYPYLVGDFMWTSWDYLGEAGIGAWSYTGGMPFDRPYPWLLSGAGVIDINGVPDASCKYAATVWGLEKKPVIGVQPVNHPGVRVSKSVWRGTNAIESWAWKGCEGNRATVEVFAEAATVELLLNGRSLGKKRIKACKATFKTRYAPGTLTAVAYDANGRELSRSELRSAEGRLSIAVTPEESGVKAGEIVYVPIALTDRTGTVESNADRGLKVTVSGGTLLAFGSANPMTTERYDSGRFTTYYGRALAVVLADCPGEMEITVCDGEDKMTAVVNVE